MVCSLLLRDFVPHKRGGEGLQRGQDRKSALGSVCSSRCTLQSPTLIAEPGVRSRNQHTRSVSSSSHILSSSLFSVSRNVWRSLYEQIRQIPDAVLCPDLAPSRRATWAGLAVHSVWPLAALTAHCPGPTAETVTRDPHSLLTQMHCRWDREGTVLNAWIIKIPVHFIAFKHPFSSPIVF